MTALILVVVLTVITVLLVAVGDRLRLPWPALMVVVSAGVAFIPAVSNIVIDPDLILPLFLPPLLFATAQRTSWALFRSRWRTIVALAIGLVVVTIAVVAGTAVALIPGITVTAAIALGAAVAPPDPVAVDAMAGPLHIPRRLINVLQSEGLFNDATSLVVFQAAIAALLSDNESFDAWVALQFLYGAGAAVAIGIAAAWLVRLATNHIPDVAARNALMLILPFAVYLAADEAHASGVIAVVVAALQIGSSQEADAIEDRLSGDAFWSVVEIVATGVAFGLIGIELREVIGQAGSALPSMLAHAGIICLVVIAVRAVWMTFATQVIPRLNDPDGAPRTAREALVLTWCGMRGLATLALALAMPDTIADGQPFPARTEIVVVACSVLVVTLVIPAFTLPSLVRILRIADDADAEQAAERPIAERAQRAAMHSLREQELPASLPPGIAERLQGQLSGMESALAGEEMGEDYEKRKAQLIQGRTVMMDLQTAALAAARAEVLKARSEPGVDPDAADRVLRRLDLRSVSGR